MLRLEARVQRVGLVEIRQHVPMALLRPIKLAEIAVGETDVVEDLRCLISPTKGAVAVQTAFERFKCTSYVAADAGDRAEILVDHRQCLGVTNGLRGDARLSVAGLGEIKIAASLVNDRD